MIPPEHLIARVMQDTGMDRLPAIRHLQSRAALIQRANRNRKRNARPVTKPIAAGSA